MGQQRKSSFDYCDFATMAKLWITLVENSHQVSLLVPIIRRATVFSFYRVSQQVLNWNLTKTSSKSQKAKNSWKIVYILAKQCRSPFDLTIFSPYFFEALRFPKEAKAKNWRNEESSASFITYRMLSNKTGYGCYGGGVRELNSPKTQRGTSQVQFWPQTTANNYDFVSNSLTHTHTKT